MEDGLQHSFDLYVIRHGETEANVAGVIQGSKNEFIFSFVPVTLAPD